MVNGPRKSPCVALLVTCLVDFFRPAVAFAAVKLLRRAQFTVAVPSAQTCCGQPAFNNGDRRGAKVLAKRTIELFSRYDYVVAPSGSCTGMVKIHYPGLLEDEPGWREKAADMAGRCYEMLTFLHDVVGIDTAPASFREIVVYHDNCAGLRELGIEAQPRRLLRSVAGLRLVEMAESQVCCGFGGTFCVKYPEIAERLVTDKVERIEQSGAATLLGGDLGCLLHIAGRLQRLHKPIRCYHALEILAGMGDQPAIGEPEKARG